MEELKYKLRNIDEPNCFQDKYSKILLKLDSSNNIFTYRYFTLKNELDAIFEHIGTYIQDRNIDELLENFHHNVGDFLAISYTSGGDASQRDFHFDYCLSLVKSALRSYVGKVEYEKSHDLNPLELVCRCAKVDSVKFEEAFLLAKGRKQDFLKDTNISSFCGGCSSLTSFKFKELEGKYEFLEGEKVDFWVSKIITLGSEFTVQDNDKLRLSVVSVEIPNVTVQVLSFDHSVIEKSDITKNLTHLFDSQLPFKTELDIKFL